MKQLRRFRRLAALTLATAAALAGGASTALLAVCGPFVDTANDGFCPFVLEIFTLGITTGTTPTTYSPGDNVSRLQMAAFLSRTVDRALLRGSRRAALDQFWSPQAAASLGITTIGTNAQLVKSDGTDLWVSNTGDSTVSRVRGADGKLLENWTGAPNAVGLLVAIGRIFATGNNAAGRLFSIDPSQVAGNVTTVASTLGANPRSLAFDGGRIWSGNYGGSVSIVTPAGVIPWTVTTVTTGFGQLESVLYDGANIWVTDSDTDKLLRLDANGGILQTVTVGTGPQGAVFDGSNIWVPNFNSSVSVVRASTGSVLATLTGNGLVVPHVAAFDGLRVLITNDAGELSLWKAADLTPLGTFATGTQTYGVCSDGHHFWVVMTSAARLARF